MILVLILSILFALAAAGAAFVTVLAGANSPTGDDRPSWWPSLILLAIAAALFAEWWWRW